MKVKDNVIMEILHYALQCNKFYVSLRQALHTLVMFMN